MTESLGSAPDDLELAMEMADRADVITSDAFGGAVEVVLKADGTPVTVVDRRVEQALQELVARQRPGDGFLGEEVGATPARRRRWIVDGIDGTHNFASGSPEWGTLIGLEADGEVVVGVATSPGLGRRWWASRGQGAWSAQLPLAPSRQPERLQVSTTRSLEAGQLVVMPPAELAHFRSGWRTDVADHLEGAAHLADPTVNGYAPLLVAAGKIDASVHLWGGPWDHAALVPIVEEAGGQFSDLWGGRSLETETAVFSNRHLHDQILSVVGEPPRPRPS